MRQEENKENVNGPSGSREASCWQVLSTRKSNDYEVVPPSFFDKCFSNPRLPEHAILKKEKQNKQTINK